MAFPGTYNVTYYKGDTFEFRVYPKDASGAPFDLTNYSTTFTISTDRGPTGVSTAVEGYSEISSDLTYILCAITPDIGNDPENFLPGVRYVYDVEIANTEEDPDQPYDRVFTLLTGDITVQDQVSNVQVSGG
jgi:hypothetical protein